MNLTNLSDPLNALKAIGYSWDSVVQSVVDGFTDEKILDAKEHKSLISKLKQHETFVAFGVIARNEEKGSENRVYQANIVKAFGPDELAKTRQDLSRRYRALEYFGIVSIDRPQPNVAIISITEMGRKIRQSHLDEFSVQLEKIAMEVRDQWPYAAE